MTILGYQIVLLVLLQAASSSDLQLGSTRMTAPQSTVDVELAGPVLTTDTTIVIARFRAQAGDLVLLDSPSLGQMEVVRLEKRRSCRRIVDAMDAYPFVCEYDVTRDLDGSGPNAWAPGPRMTSRLLQESPIEPVFERPPKRQ